MFAYCLNNPISMIDPTGSCGYIYSIYFWSDCGEIDCPQSKNYVDCDFTEELAVLRGETDTYKGVTVHRDAASGTGFSYGSIHIDPESGDSWSDIMLLRHEYGHTVQLEELGYAGYTALVVIPSVGGFLADSIGILDALDTYYYSLPWERQADTYGGVIRNYPTDIRMGYAYMEYEFFVARVTGDEEFFSQFSYL